MALGEISVIYIYRNIYDVAESLNHKAKKGTENRKNDKNYVKVAERWNTSLQRTLKLLNSGKEFLV